ncbi:MAG TPA: hypothetical protein VNA25_30515 [Phycisphaerae bacterium]|nr:hypothetical protein [Phycisphaerae bacterium]
MPYVKVEIAQFCLFEEGEQREYVRGEVLRLGAQDPLIQSGQVSVLSDSDFAETVVCTCGRRFWNADNPHFMADEHETINAEPMEAMGIPEQALGGGPAAAIETLASSLPGQVESPAQDNVERKRRGRPPKVAV